MTSTILVTGAAGFIGSHLVERLLERGERVVVIDDFNDYYDPAIKEANVAGFVGRADVIRGDIRDAALLLDVCGRYSPDVVVHLAARAGVRPSVAQPQLYLDVNVTGTLNVLEAVRHCGTRRLIFAGSSSVYGSNTPPFREDQPLLNPISPYAATKIAGEALCRTYAALYGIQVTVLRFFTVYGPRQRPDLAIHKFTRLIDEGKPIPVYGDGSMRRDHTYIDDILQGILAALSYTGGPFEVFNLGESDTVPLTRLIETIEAALGKKAILDHQPVPPGDVPITHADISKAQRVLGYRPTTRIEDGIPRFIAWYRAMRQSVA